MKNISLVEAQRTFFAAGPTQSIEFRKKALKKLQSALHTHTNGILKALADDMGKSPFEAQVTELALINQELKTALKNIHCWTRMRRVKTSFPLVFTQGFLRPEPYGCTIIIAAWNYPFQLSLVPLIGAVAAGNCAIVKPSEYAPRSAALIAQIIEEVFDPGHVTTLLGGIPETEDLLSHRFDYIFLTGSTQVGKKVMQKAADHLTPVTLELGGKSPCIVAHDADLTLAAQRIVWGKFTNAGQNCVSPDYLLVDERIASSFITLLQKEIVHRFGTHPQQNPSYGRIINNFHTKRLQALMAHGTIVHGGQIDTNDRYIAPTVLTHVALNSPLMQEEIFGPLLPIITYHDLSQAYAIIKQHPKPIALYCFSRNNRTVNQVITTLSAGGICINDTLLQAAHKHLPFGGIGMSGMGAYHGKYTFDTFSHYKPIVKSSRWALPWRTTTRPWLQRIMGSLLEPIPKLNFF